jgi:hypothetical protein
MMVRMALEEPAGDARAADNNNKKYLKRYGPDSKEFRAFSFAEPEDGDLTMSALIDGKLRPL